MSAPAASHPVSPSPSALDTARYRALQARDARFDGQFFIGVRSTGVYCRPVCKVRTPGAAQCRFFDCAAQAEAAGFRPCLRCRPELAPAWPGQRAVWSRQDATWLLAQQAAQALEPATAQGEPTSVAAVAQHLGVSTRHLQRIFQAHWGVAPLQYLQTRRLLLAKQLLSDTALPMAEVAHMAGFGSVRAFNSALQQHYRLSPSQVRASARQTHARPAQDALECTLYYRPPYDVGALLQFLAARAIPGLEWVECEAQRITRSCSLRHQGQDLHGWVQARFAPERCAVHLRTSATLAPALATVLARVRAWLDLDADPGAIAAVLQADFPGQDGVRLPGCLDPLELGVRAILGQQVTVAAARTLATRLVQALGEPLETPWPQLSQRFPSAATLAACSADTLGALGLVRQRQQAVLALAQGLHRSTLALEPGSEPHAAVAALQALPGIGAWTAHYIAMRALHWSDAELCADVALHKALGLRGQPRAAQRTRERLQAWAPWRSYATLRAWNLLSKG
ncbi:MAG: DNA-3-methyladenine glycosylase 2 family protein [Rhodoferax sp.]